MLSRELRAGAGPLSHAASFLRGDVPPNLADPGAWIAGFASVARTFYVVMGIVIFAVWLLTDYRRA